MKEINNLIYGLEINYINNSGIDTTISVQFHDNGFKMESFRLGNFCIAEEKINGRILGGRFDNLDGFCGYRYDYKNGGKLLNINPSIPLDTAIDLINKKKLEEDFQTAKLVLSSILRNDYRVVILNSGSLNITKTVSAENEKFQNCTLQECVNLLKLEGEENFVEQSKKRIYKIDDKCVIEEDQPIVDSDIKSQLSELSDIISQHPQDYKKLMEIKNQIDNSVNEDKVYE